MNNKLAIAGWRGGEAESYSTGKEVSTRLRMQYFQ